MLLRRLILLGIAALIVAVAARSAFGSARTPWPCCSKVTDGGKIDDTERQKAHEACQRALAETSSIMQKYHLQEADFDILGRSPKTSN